MPAVIVVPAHAAMEPVATDTVTIHDLSLLPLRLAAVLYRRLHPLRRTDTGHEDGQDCDCG